MIKATLETDDKRLQQLLDLTENYTDEVFDLVQGVYDDLYPRFIQDLRYTPRRRVYPGDYPGGMLEWTTPRQQRWYWANIGKPHTRTGAMMKALDQVVKRQPQSLEIETAYNSTKTKFVVGDIHGADTTFMQNFHRITGWQPVAPKLDQQAQLYYDTILRHYEAFIGLYNA